MRRKSATAHARRLLPALLALGVAACLYAATTVQAQGAEGLLRVSANVARRTALRVQHPGTVVLTEADVRRGSIEVNSGVEVLVASNTPEGYALAFERQGDAVQQVQVLGLAQPLTLDSGTALALRPATAQRGRWTERLVLRFRFMLAPHARPGPHAWPVRISLMSQ